MKPVIINDTLLEERLVELCNTGMIFKCSTDGCLNTAILTEILEDLIE